MTLDEKIAEARENLGVKKTKKREVRAKDGKWRKETIVERCGKWTIGWVIFWAVLAGSSWTYAWDHKNELVGTRTVVITPAEAKTTNGAQKEVESPQSSKSEAKEGEFTAYNAEESQTDADPYTMASNKRVYEGAVANNCLPFGTKIKVNGKIKIVDDRMKAGTDCDHFDIFMESHEEAINFGRKTLTYEIL